MRVLDMMASSVASGATGVGLGNFDGLHIGHMALIHTLVSECRMSGLSPAVFTFTKHPDHILRKDLYQPLITSLSHKTEILARQDIDWLCLQEFDDAFSQLSAEDFVRDILLARLRARLVVVGFNYRFGYQGEGDTAMLRRLGERHGFRVIVVPPVKVEDEVVSSTLIRSYIGKGEMEHVFHLLGRHFSIPGVVADGRRIGRQIGFPTANLYPEPEMAIPAFGVYITRTRSGQAWHDSVTSIGLAPTVRTDDSFSIETHLLGFREDLYGKEIEVAFLSRLRGEIRFDGLEALKAQIGRDIADARAYFSVSPCP
jgi:riboflavin kinase/FMN adenylyltransferase